MRISLTLLDVMAAASSRWHMEQKERVSTYQPTKPEMPNDHRCAEGDTFCKNQIPPPPVEHFSGNAYSSDWIAVMCVAVFAFVIATRIGSSLNHRT
jgi:hypothetical protein